MKSVDASAHVKDAALLCELMDGFIQDIGAHNVVQVISDNVANYVAAAGCLWIGIPLCFGLHALLIALI